MNVRSALPKDREDWLRLRCLLWPGDRQEHAREIDRFFIGTSAEPTAVLMAFEAEEAIGFAELSIRSYAQGCDTQNVAYLEGWYVQQAWRRRGVGRALVEAAMTWGRERGCREFASDALTDNDVSAAAHIACGFSDAGLIRCFKKTI